MWRSLAPPGKGSWRRSRMRRPSISLLKKIEKHVIPSHDRWAKSSLFREFGPRPSILMSQATPEFANPSAPNPASAHDPLLAAALIWAHRDAISMVYVPFLERLPLGPQDAFARCVDEARP